LRKRRQEAGGRRGWKRASKAGVEEMEAFGETSSMHLDPDFVREDMEDRVGTLWIRLRGGRKEDRIESAGTKVLGKYRYAEAAGIDGEIVEGGFAVCAGLDGAQLTLLGASGVGEVVADRHRNIFQRLSGNLVDGVDGQNWPTEVDCATRWIKGSES
jgi:hypothetical protein